MKFSKRSLRKKILLLSLMPAIAVTIVLAFIIWNSSRRASTIVRTNVTDFMVVRTQKSLHHGYASAEVTANYIDRELRLNMNIAQLILAATGGISLQGPPATRELIGDEKHVGGQTSLQPIRFGSDLLNRGRSDIVQEVAQQTGGLAVVFQRVGKTGDLVRVAASSPAVRLNTFLGKTTQDAAVNPAEIVASGNAYVGRTLEAGEWHIGRYEPLRDTKGEIIGSLYLGQSVNGVKSLQQELAANSIGVHGSVAIIYAHGPQRGQMLVKPFDIAEETESQWLPVVMSKSLNMRDAQEEALDVPSKDGNDAAIVRFSYIQKYDWILVAIADAKELRQASVAVKQEFSRLQWTMLIAGLLTLGTVGALSWLMSRRVVDPLLGITIQLTSSGTQIASSASQQLNAATSFNVSSTEVATAVKEISSTSQELLRAMEELSQEAARASEIAREGGTVLAGFGASIELLERAGQTISSSLTAIREKAGKINAVTAAVTKVADQTNLLSLNAAIEAEKAGEAGAGFGVVAREIRRLADQSARASQEIEQTIREMQDAVGAGGEEVRALTDAVEKSTEVSELVRAQFSEIIARVEAMTPRYEMVHLGMQNQSEGAQQISEAMWQLTETASQTTDAVAELNQVSLELHRAVNILKQRIFEGADETAPPETLLG
ncbi:Cache 3/Cache 2 fusion domain-containing protein [Terriglobus sp. RCC_193]|uniref:methyl-accepting chemotaxis protein n=1 Tax=Terriglobus sp. RCC_193 TaxID=3239218 RepID=UPI00352405CB